MLDAIDQLMRIGENDVLIAITFPRYSTRTVEAVQVAKAKGAKVIAITDSTLSPIAPPADYALMARSDMASFVDSLVAPLKPHQRHHRGLWPQPKGIGGILF